MDTLVWMLLWTLSTIGTLTLVTAWLLWPIGVIFLLLYPLSVVASYYILSEENKHERMNVHKE